MGNNTLNDKELEKVVGGAEAMRSRLLRYTSAPSAFVSTGQAVSSSQKCGTVFTVARI